MGIFDTIHRIFSIFLIYRNIRNVPCIGRSTRYVRTLLYFHISEYTKRHVATFVRISKRQWNLDTHRDNVLGEDEGTSTEANHAAAAAGLSHVDVVVRVALQASVVHLSHQRAAQAA